MSNPSNNFILVPEIAIEKILSNSISFIRSDYQNSVDELKDEKLSYLYHLTSTIHIERLDVFKEAKKLFLISDDRDAKRIQINLGWPRTISEAVNITITHAGEQYAQNALGVDQGPDIYEEYVGETEESNAWRNTYGRRYSATYQLIITGDNTNETLIVYNILKSLLISFEGTSHLSAIGFQNVRILGQDMVIKSDIVKNKYAKNLSFSFEYEFRVPDTNRMAYWNSLIFKGFLKNNLND